jgi:hypothetical protein
MIEEGEKQEEAEGTEEGKEYLYGKIIVKTVLAKRSRSRRNRSKS